MRKTLGKTVESLPAAPGEATLPVIRQMIEAARRHVSAAADLTFVLLCWNIGRVIAEDIQRNDKRAKYGEQLLKTLSEALTRQYGRGYSRANLQDMRRFFHQFPICQPLASKFVEGEICQPLASISPASRTEAEKITIEYPKHSHISWTHYRILLPIDDVGKKRFYLDQASSGRWAKRELARQIDSALYERVALSKDTRKLVKMEKAKPACITQYDDAFKDPYILDFLGLVGAYSEKDLESAIVANLEKFLREMGTDFCFIGRQHRMRIDDTDYYLDLLFYHRGLKCLVAIDLKIGEFSAADKGQMDLYLAWLKEHDWREGEGEPVGLVLCTSKKRHHVELLLRHGPHKMKVSEYLLKFPDAKLLEERLALYSELLKDTESGHPKTGGDS